MPASVDLVRALRHAADDGTLVVHLQPEIDLASGAVVAMEALVRWEHPVRGLLWPGDFLAAADAEGLLPRIGWAVITRCVDELSSWRSLTPLAGGGDRQLWVNVSVSQLLEPDFVERLADLVARRELPRGALGLELDERALATGSYARRLLDDLATAGVALAVDNVTAWYSWLATLRESPIEAVKLDRGFVRGVGNDVEGDTVVASVIDLAHRNGLRVVAEGVESWSEGARLCELGCDRGMGYLFSGPQRPEHARLMLAHGAGWTRPSTVRIPAQPTL
jgi:EAL domain-containing protein (putative c-di-GMP-specific phosphodiesterase class I)